MRSRNSYGFRIHIANIMCIMMLVCVLFSALFIAVEARHECTDEDCPVCACMQYCENILNRISGDVPAVVCVLIPFIISSLIFVIPVILFIQDTLVLNKVRLND